MDWLIRRLPTTQKQRVMRCATTAFSLFLLKACFPCGFFVQNAENLLKEIYLRDPPSNEKSMIRFKTVKVLMRKISVQSTEIKRRDFSSLMPCVNHIQFFDERSRVVNNPKAIVIFVKFTLIVKILDLIED